MNQRFTIILAEDDAFLRTALVRLLERSGYKVVEANDGRAALLHLSQGPAHLVILDMLMPEMEGAETISAIRSRYPAVKILATSGGGLNPPEDYLQLARALGAHLALPKPWVPAQLLAAVAELVGNTSTDPL